MDLQKIRIGTSGYSFRDWIGPFYPAGTAKSDMLPYYAQRFNCVEVNSTYYRIPHPAVFYHMSQKTPDDFTFIVKVNRETTHTRKENAAACQQLLESVHPLIESGKFDGFLAQFPYSFKNNGPNRRYLIETRNWLGTYPLHVEFRHRSWSEPGIYQLLKSQDIGYVCVDEPDLGQMLPPQDISTTNTGYVRFHGRNASTWWHPEKGDRYDYRYSRAELQDWKGRIEKMLNEVKKLYLFFNNCHHGQAPENAFDFIDLLQE